MTSENKAASEGEVAKIEDIKAIRKAIDEDIARLKKATTSDELVAFEGETSCGYIVQGFVPEKDVADLFLKYNASVFRAIEMDYLDEMWEEIAVRLGLASVMHVDL